MPKDPNIKRLDKNQTWITVGIVASLLIGSVALIVAAVGFNQFSTDIDKTTLDYANHYSLMPTNNSGTVAVGGDVAFAMVGPAMTSTGIVAINTTAFRIATAGVYDVNFFVTVAEAGQLAITLNGVVVAGTVTGRSATNSIIMGSYIIVTTVVNTTLTVRNPTGNAAALTITTTAGGASTVSCNLNIIRIA